MLLVSNRAHWHYVYIFSVAIKAFQGLLRFRHWEFNHALRVVDGQTFEQLAHGRDSVTIEEWEGRQNRTVMVFRADRFQDVPASKYGYLDIVAVVWHYLLQKIGLEQKRPRDFAGLFCSEEVALALNAEKPHLVLPCMVPSLPGLEYVGTFQTVKR